MIGIPNIAFALLAAAAAPAPDDAWPLVEKAAQLAAAIPASPLADRARGLERQALPLDDEDVADSLEAIRAAAAAVAALDAANAAGACTVGREVPALDKLADAALITALADAADGKPARAAAGVGRVADLAALLSRCARPSLASAQAALALSGEARRAAWFLSEQRLVDVTKAAQMAAGLAASAQPALLERAIDGEKARRGRAGLGAAEQKRLEQLGKELDAQMKDQAALTSATASADAWEKIPRPARTVDVRCDAGKDEAHRTVTRAVAHALARKTADALAQDSVVGPSLDGRGLLVVSAGPIARSCGFRDGDVVVEVNGVSVARVDVALGQAPQQVARDGFATFRAVRLGGAVAEWRVDVAP